ncbi:hypothetical protein MMC30_000532 [Trapelia coarctata]|nr:hypothetical protein [Trapelia coarctata]
MSHHIIDLTQSPAGMPVAPRAQPSAPKTAAPKRLPSSGNQAPNDPPETVETMKRLISDTVDVSPEARLRSVLKRVMDKHPIATEWIGAELLVAEDRVKPWKEGDDDLGNSDGEIPESSEEEDEEEESDSDSSEDVGYEDSPGPVSRYSDLEIDYESDTWVDWDEDCHGSMDTKKHRSEYPDGFRWTCCNRSGDEDGCQKGRHKAKRGRETSNKGPAIPKAPAIIKTPIAATSTAKASAGVKRLRSRYARCVNCEEEFDTTYNEPGNCVWHEGEMEVDWDGDFWADNDEATWGPVDTEDNRKSYPEGFIWTCCDKNGEEAGCKIGRHREEPETVKRPRMTPPKPDPSTLVSPRRKLPLELLGQFRQ